MRTDEQAIRDVIANWMQASAAGDLPQILSLMSEDVVFLTCGHPPMRGRDAFAAAFQPISSNVHIEGSSNIQEIKISGGLAYVWNHITVTITPKNGGEQRSRAGYTLTIFRKEADGSWVLIRDANLMAP